MTDYIISHAYIVTMNPARRIIEDGGLAVQGDRIAAVGSDAEIRNRFRECREIIDIRGKYLFPGFVNTHTHSFQALLKGLETDTDLDRWLKNVITPSVASVTPEEAYYGAVLSGIDALRSGTTTITDYQYAQYDYDLNPAVISGFRDMGIRLVYARGYADTGVQFGASPDELETPGRIEEGVVRLLREYPGGEDAAVTIALAPSAVWMCSLELLKWTADFAKKNDLLVTSHIAETEYDNECSIKVHGCGDFPACGKYGLINEKMLMVHGVQLKEDEIRRAAEAGAKFSYNPVSNMYLASGAAPVQLMKKYRITGSFGTDGAASNNTNDMLETIKSGILLAKVHYRDPAAFTAENALEYATISGARALGMEGSIGSLETGKKADFFVFNPSADAKSTPCHDPVAGLAYASGQRNIETVFVGGRPVVRNNVLTGADEGVILRKAGKAASELRLRIQ